MIHFIGAFWLSNVAHFASILVCIFALIRQLKTPKLSKEYFIKVAYNQYGQNLIYILVFLFYREQRNIFYFFPLMIHFWIGICEYFHIQRNSVYTRGAVLINNTRANKDRLLQLKSQYEIALFPFILVLIFFGKTTVFLILFYYNFIKIKYFINTHTSNSFKTLNEKCK